MKINYSFLDLHPIPENAPQISEAMLNGIVYGNIDMYQVMVQVRAVHGKTDPQIFQILAVNSVISSHSPVMIWL